jgi:hypothetical protein
MLMPIADSDIPRAVSELAKTARIGGQKERIPARG